MTTDERLSDLTGLGNGTSDDRHYFAEIAIVDDFDCVLEKGSGKLPFDPSYHRPEQRRVSLSLTLVCTKRDGSTYELKQDDITSGSKHKITLQSLEALGVVTRSQLRDLVGQWAEIVRVPTGRKYAAKKDAADGSYKAGDLIPEPPALKFVRLFPDADACKAAETAFYTPKSDPGAKNAPQPIDDPAPAGVATAARDTLLKTIPVLWTAAGQNRDAFCAILTQNPGYAAAGLTWDDEDVQNSIGNGIPF